MMKRPESSMRASMMAQSAAGRLGAAALVLLVLWLAIAWAVSLP